MTTWGLRSDLAETSKAWSINHDRGLQLPQCQEGTIPQAPEERCRRIGTLMTGPMIGPGFPVCISCATYYAEIRPMTDQDRISWLQADV